MKTRLHQTVLRGALFIIGSAFIYTASNFLAVHDTSTAIVFTAALLGNVCLTWVAYLDQSHAKFHADKLITDIAAAPDPEPTPAT